MDRGKVVAVLLVVVLSVVAFTDDVTQLGRRKKKLKSKDEEKVVVVYCVTGHYIEGMAASILSIIKGSHPPHSHRLRFRIMVAQGPEVFFLESYLEDLILASFDPHTAESLLSIPDFFLVRLFDPPPHHNSRLFQLRQGLGDTRLKNVMNAARFYIHEVFPELHKYIYLDADIILHNVNITKIFDESLQTPYQMGGDVSVNLGTVKEFYDNREAGITTKEDEVREFWGPEDLKVLRKLKGPDYEPILLSAFFYLNHERAYNGTVPFDGTFSYGNFFIVDMHKGGRIDPYVERLFDMKAAAFYGGFWITDMREWVSRNITGRVEEWMTHHNKFETGIFKGLTNAPLLAVFYRRWENIALREPDIKFASLLGYSSTSYRVHKWTNEQLLNSTGVFEWQGPAKPWLLRGRAEALFAPYAPPVSWRTHVMWKIKTKMNRPALGFLYSYDSDDLFSFDVLDSLLIPSPSSLWPHLL